MSKEVRAKRICIRGRHPVLLFKAKVGGPDQKSSEGHPSQRDPYGVLAPSAGDTVSSPFTAYGLLDQGATSASVTLTSETTGVTQGGTNVDPTPYGADWAVEFNVPPDDYYLKDVETGGGTYTVDPIHVI